MNKLYTSLGAGVMSFMLAGAVQEAGAATIIGNAQYTNIASPWGPNETHADILSQIYKGTFVKQANGLDYANEFGIYVERIPDYRRNPDGSLGVYSAVGSDDRSTWTDELWASVFDFAEAKARYAAKEQTFGVISGQSAGDRTQIFKLEGDKDQVSGHGDVTGTGEGLFRWYRGPETIYTSRAQDNVDKLDHMVTYQVHGLGQYFGPKATPLVDGDLSDQGGVEIPTFLLFWEDLQVGNHVDYDFNDLVVEVTGYPVYVPEPTALLGVVAGAGLLLRRNRRA